MSARATPTQELTPHEAERLSRTATLNGITYRTFWGLPNGSVADQEYAGYLLSEPSGPPKATIFLVHGWPDLAFGWRCQIPLLTSLGFRVVAPDMIGYGGTDAPPVPPNDIGLYSFKRASDDLATLAQHLGCTRVILGGHDWGGMVVYRFGQWYPHLVSHIFSVCTPFIPPTKRFYTNEDLANGPVPQFGYQVQLASGEVEEAVKSRSDVEQFLRGLYGGKVPEGEVFMTPEKGINLSLLGRIQRSAGMSQEVEQYVVDQYLRNGIHGPLNWYRTRRINFEEETELPRSKLKQPVLFIIATRDNILTRDLGSGMHEFVPTLFQQEVAAGHWALWKAAAEVNEQVRQWLENVVLKPTSHL